MIMPNKSLFMMMGVS